MRPPIWVATAKPMKKKSRNTPASLACLPSEICAYSLENRNSGTNTSIAMPRTRFSTRNVRLRKMSMSISGDSVRRWTR